MRVMSDVDRQISRRRLVVGSAALAALAACDRSSSDGGSGPTSSAPTTEPSTTAPTTTAPTTTAPTTTTPPTTTPSPTPTGPPDWNGLAQGLQGGLIRPQDASFAASYQLFNPRYDDVQPQAVAQVETPQDLQECVRFANRYDVPLAIRSGGHCYAGWSVGPGLVIDVRKLSAVSTSGGSAQIGSGAPLIDVYTTLAGSGVGIPGGSCPTVGIAGLALGGGIGVVDRAWGLTCDSVTAVQIVTADGQLRTCDAKRDPDLYWACRGGGGGTFGVVTGMTFRTHPTQDMVKGYLSWPWEQAAAVIAGWQSWIAGAPDELWSAVSLSSGDPTIGVSLSYLGDQGTLDGLLSQLYDAIGSGPSYNSLVPRSYLDTMLSWAGCEDDASCHLPPRGTYQREAWAGSSDIVGRRLSGSGIGALISLVQSRHDAGGSAVSILVDALGGAINRVSPGATAFVHRRALATVQYYSGADWAWPHAARQAMSAYMSGAAYQNYVDEQIGDWQSAYFGANYPRLQKVKARYDPDNLFNHPQSVRG